MNNKSNDDVWYYHYEGLFQCMECKSFHREITTQEAAQEILRLKTIYCRLTPEEQHLYNMKNDDIPTINDFYNCQYCRAPDTSLIFRFPNELKNIKVKNPAPVVRHNRSQSPSSDDGL